MSFLESDFGEEDLYPESGPIDIYDEDIPTTEFKHHFARPVPVYGGKGSTEPVLYGRPITKWPVRAGSTQQIFSTYHGPARGPALNTQGVIFHHLSKSPLIRHHLKRKFRSYSRQLLHETKRALKHAKHHHTFWSWLPDHVLKGLFAGYKVAKHVYQDDIVQDILYGKGSTLTKRGHKHALRRIEHGI